MPERHIHMHGQNQWPYNDWLAGMCGPDVPATPAWRLQLWEHARHCKQKYSPDQYRDEWDDESSIRAAHAAFEAELLLPGKVAV